MSKHRQQEDSSSDITARLGSLSVSLLADTLYSLGFKEQVMNHRMRPVIGKSTLAGPAYPIQARPASQISQAPFGHGLLGLEAAMIGSVVVVGTEEQLDIGCWGAQVCAYAMANGIVGAVIDGGIRDSPVLMDMGLPTYCSAISANPPQGRLEIVNSGGSAICADVNVKAGDYVVGDPDGVVVIPSSAVHYALSDAESKISAQSGS